MPLPHEEQVLRALELPFWYTERHSHVDQPPYFVVWRPDGTVLKSEGIAAQNLPAFDNDLVRDLDGRPQFVVEGDGPGQPPTYQLWMRGPAGSIILVGRSIEPELRRINQLTWQVIAAGTAVFAVGLLGGWWLSSSAIRPIAAMSETAASITASNLSQRVDLKEVDTELAELGSTLNEMLSRLEGAFRQQTQFTSDASHELRTPLAVILSHIELALSQRRSAEDYRETLATCQRAAQRMRTLVDDLLTLARADAGRLELRLSPVELLQTARDAAVMLEPLAAQHQVELRVEGTPVRAMADPARLAQVVTNLVTNAILYNRPQGRVTVSVREEAGLAVLQVGDTGIGIAAHDQPRLFDRFYRVDRARSRDLGGSGLGLAISKSIVEAQHGSISVTSELDQGTVFVVRLPKG
jgi:heavy metal sensor kinase